MQAEVQTRIVVYAAMASLIAYDLCAVAFGWRTITQQVRAINLESGWLLGLAWAGLWLHFFWVDGVRGLLWLFGSKT